ILVNDVRKLPIKKCDEITQVRMISYVEQILEKKEIDSNADTSDLERLIDSIVYEIYGLTETEIKIVEAID
ncbi:hypothetical protein, partial [Acetobacterium fimetarium]|uniref:hypothetical protein n=1 Tax=Acetobacterium fimetarium TaxID=52691 RepID=UPI001A9AD9B8